MGQKENLSGERFGRLRVLRESYRRDVNGNVYWWCKCDCGTEKEIVGVSLRKAGTKSCGCLQKEAVSKCNTKHGLSRTNIYRRWTAIKQRCTNPNKKGYELWGGRGITICKEWEDDFEAFREWAISNGYRRDLDIDRIDNNKGYSPDNCRWVTRTVNLNNTRGNVRYTYDGKTMTVTQWSRYLGGSDNLITNRLKRGWCIEDALSKKAEQKFNQRGKKK